MKNFLKKNLWLIIGFIIGITLIFLGSVSLICLLLGAVVTGILLLALAYRFRNRYKEMLAAQEENNPVFDATLYDYDEDIYIIDTGKRGYKSKIKEGFSAKLSAQAPFIFFITFGIGLIVLSLTLVLRFFIM